MDNVALPEALAIAYKVAYTVRKGEKEKEEEEDAASGKAGEVSVPGMGAGPVGRSDSARARERLSAKTASARARETATVEEDEKASVVVSPDETFVDVLFGDDDDSAKKGGKASEQAAEFSKAAYVILRYLCDVIEGDREKFDSRIIGVAMETARPNGRLTLAVISHLR